jgi:iron complex transport system substrate-binding protein
MRRGLVQVSIEQVIVADPDIILTWDRRFYESVWHNPYWSGISAVRNGRVYLAPTAPFGWIDRPPSLNRLIGVKWLFGLFFPERAKADLGAEVREFYRLFYHIDLDDEELERLITWSRPRKN